MLEQRYISVFHNTLQYVGPKVYFFVALKLLMQLFPLGNITMGGLQNEHQCYPFIDFTFYSILKKEEMYIKRI